MYKTNLCYIFFLFYDYYHKNPKVKGKWKRICDELNHEAFTYV